MLKRRRLSSEQEVIIIYDKTGFVEKPATFVRYERVAVGKANHEVPVFDYDDKKITGLDCFWILPTDAKNPDKIQKLQYNLLRTQVAALEIGKKSGYDVPQKIKDAEIRKMAEENTHRRESLIAKFGFDPSDTSWIEVDLASTTRERNWFRFERENNLALSDKWDDMVEVYNNQFEDNITIDEAKQLSRKWYRFILGSHNVRITGDKDKEKWKQQARGFEKTHREREVRMRKWSMNHADHFPHVRARKPINFFAGPYFNECIERAPQIFTDTSCTWIKEGNILRVISYDTELKYIRLDFTEDIHKLIRGEVDPQPWKKDGPDYDMWLKPEEIETHLDVLEDLE